MITLRKRLLIQSTNIWLLALRQPGFSKLCQAHHSRIKYDCLNGNNVMRLYNFVWKPSCDSWTVGSIKPSHWAKAKSPPPSQTDLLYCTRVGFAQWFGLPWDQLVYWRVTADWDKCDQAVPKDTNAKSPIPLFVSLSLSFETLSPQRAPASLSSQTHYL